MAVVSFVLFFVLALREQLTNGLFFFFQLEHRFSVFEGANAKGGSLEIFPPLLEAVCPWTFFEGR